MPISRKTAQIRTRRLAIKNFNGGGSRPPGGPGGSGGGSGGSSGGPRAFDRGGPRKGGKDSLRVNGEIRGAEVRVIDEDGTMLGVFSPQEALRMAEGKGLDLIEIAPTAKPPTCKIMDYGKFKYENKKKEHQARKNQTVIVIKEIQLRPRTDQHDLEVKLRHARRFLLEGDKVKVNLRFYGREMAHQELGMNLLKKVANMINDIAMVEVPPKMEGRQLFVLFAPDPGKIKDLEKTYTKDVLAQGKVETGDSTPEPAVRVITPGVVTPKIQPVK
jgi:translation initiation factor IF-3